jgi:hypothetical protein
MLVLLGIFQRLVCFCVSGLRLVMCRFHACHLWRNLLGFASQAHAASEPGGDAAAAAAAAAGNASPLAALEVCDHCAIHRSHAERYVTRYVRMHVAGGHSPGESVPGRHLRHRAVVGRVR